NPDLEAACARQSPAHDSELDPGIALSISLVEETFLRVEAPALGHRAAPSDLPHVRRRPFRVEEMNVVARIDLVDRHGRKRPAAESLEVLLDLRLGPGFLRQRDVVVGVGRFGLERSRAVEAREGPARLEGGRGPDAASHLGWNRDEVRRDAEAPRSLEEPARV